MRSSIVQFFPLFCDHQAEEQRCELKHRRQLEELRAGADASVKELEQLQNEKRKVGTVLSIFRAPTTGPAANQDLLRSSNGIGSVSVRARSSFELK